MNALHRTNRRAALARIAAFSALATRAPALHAQTRSGRLVTIGGGITEVVYALGAETQLVGTDSTSLFPAAAQSTPKVGYMRQLSAEGVLSLHPDALVATTEAGPPVVVDQLRTAGVRVELVEADHTWSEVQRKVQAVGRASGREAAAQGLLQQLDSVWQDAQARVLQARGRKPRALFILAHGASPQVSGRATAADAMLRFAGAVNAIDAFQGYRPMTAEAMASAAPDFIVTTSQGITAQGGADAFWSRPELALTPAYKRRALIAMDALLLLGFGPRMPAAVGELHGRLTA